MQGPLRRRRISYTAAAAAAAAAEPLLDLLTHFVRFFVSENDKKEAEIHAVEKSCIEIPHDCRPFFARFFFVGEGKNTLENARLT